MPHPNPLSILIVDDNETMRAGMMQILNKEGHHLEEADSGQTALSLIKNQDFDLMITDFRMEGMSGLELLAEAKKRIPVMEVMVITAYGSIELAVEAMKSGAWDFLTKPFSQDELKLKVARVSTIIHERRDASNLTDENRFLKKEMELRLNFGELIGESKPMKRVYRTIEKVAGSDTSVLILGESGTGKELVARAVHYQSRRNERPFIRVNCGALAEGVLESELFGHEKGAFTGAVRQKKGRFELAQKGTLFLDEIGDIPLATQVKLLRVLQEKEYERVGGEETLKTDVRIIAATHRDLAAMSKQGEFREDLYYRLNILPVQLPPLKERKEDIPSLAIHFLNQLSNEMGKTGLSLTEEAMALLSAYEWPGNIRELSNILERAVVLADSQKIDREDLNFMMPAASGTNIVESPLDLDARLSQLERDLIEKAMKAAKGVKARAARLLGLKESALYYKLEKYGLDSKR